MKTRIRSSRYGRKERMRFVKGIVKLLPGLVSVTVHCGLEKGEGRDMHGARTMGVDKTGVCSPREVAARGLI